MRVFISSPSDLAAERKIVLQVLTRLGSEFKHHFALTPVLWEHEPLLATEHFQEGLVSPAECDIVLCMLWSRVGSALPENRFRRADGSAGVTGTEWEFQMAAEAFERTGKPEILFYRKTAPVQVSLEDEAALERAQQQKRAVDAFFMTHFHNDDADRTFKNAYWTFNDIADLEEQVYTHLGALLRKHVGAARDDDAPVMWHQGSPYLGLRAFELEHADIYFGRNRARSEAFEQFSAQAAQASGFMMLLGTSGSGKSSLVKAGVLPMLLTPGVIEGVAECRWSVFKPSDASGDLSTALLDALLGPACLPEIAPTDADRSSVRERVAEAPHALEALVFAALNAAKHKTGYREELNVRLVIIIDQFEELFSLPFTSEQRRGFVSLLHSLVASGHTYVLGTMRSDFYVHCEALPELVDMMRGNGQFHLTPPSGEEIAQMIEMPARAAGLRFERDADGIGLDEVLRSTAQGEPAILPLLSFTLQQLFDARDGNLLTHAAYAEMGGIEGAITRRAEEVFSQLEPACQQELPALLRALVTIRSDETESVSARRCEWAAVAANAEREALAEAFIEARLLSVSGEAQSVARTVAVAHEALLRNWHRAREWIADNIEHLRARTRIATTARSWDAEGRPDGMLLPAGTLLEQGLRLADAEHALDVLEHDFVHASEARLIRERDAAVELAAAAKRTRRRQWAALAVVAAGVIAAGVLLLEGRAARDELDRLSIARAQQSEDSRINSFARLSMSQTRAGDSLNGLHLGIEAARRSAGRSRAGGSEANAALHAAVWAQPRSFSTTDAATVVQNAAGQITGMVFAGDPIRVFDPGLGHLRALPGARGRVLASAGNSAVTENHGQWALWDWISATRLATGSGAPASASAHALSADGSTWVRLTGNGQASALQIVRHGADGRLQQSSIAAPGHVFAALSADGLTALTADAQGRGLGHDLRQLDAPRSVALEDPAPSPLQSVRFLHGGILLGDRADGTRVLWRADDGRRQASLPGSGTHQQLAPWPSERRPELLLLGVGSHGIRVIEAASGAVRAILLHDETVTAFVATGAGVASVDAGGATYVWNPRTGAGVRRAPATTATDAGEYLATGFHSTASGALIVTQGARASLLADNGASFVNEWPLDPALEHGLTTLGDTLAVREDPNTVAIRDARSGSLRVRLRAGHEVVPMAAHPRSGRFATLSFGRVVEHRDAANGQVLVSAVAAHEVESLRYSANGQHLVAAGDGHITAWALHTLSRIPRFEHSTRVVDADVDPASGTIAVVGGEWLSLRDRFGGLAARKRFASDVVAVALEPGGARLAVGLASGEVRVLAPADNLAELVSSRITAPVRTIRWQALDSGKRFRLLLTDADRRLVILNEHGELTRPASHWASINAVIGDGEEYLSASGKHLLQWRYSEATEHGASLGFERVAAFSGPVEALSRGAGIDHPVLVLVREPGQETHVHDREDGRELGQIPIARERIAQYAASPDGSRVAVLDQDHRLRVWALSASEASLRMDAELYAELTGALPLRRSDVCQPERGGVFARETECVLQPRPTRLAFSSDGQRLLLGRSGQAILVYDANSGRRVFAALNADTTIGFTLDNRAVLTRSSNGELKDVALGDTADVAPALTARLPLKPFESPVELRGGEGVHVPYRVRASAPGAEPLAPGKRLTVERSSGADETWQQVAEVLDASERHAQVVARMLDGRIAVIDLANGALLARIPALAEDTADGVRRAARFSQDGSRLVVWRGNQGAVWPLHGREVSAVAERILAGGSE